MGEPKTMAQYCNFEAPVYFCEISSISEPDMVKLVIKRTEDIIAFCVEQLIRVYPGFKRYASDNYSPLPMWLAGAQVPSYL